MLPEKLGEMIRELAEADRQDRIELLIDLARELPPLPEHLSCRCDANHRVQECQSPVFLFVETQGNKVLLHADAPIESPTIRGFVSMLLAGLNEATIAEILSLPGDLVDRAGLTEVVGMLRLRGLHGILKRIKTEVARLAALGEPAVTTETSAT